MQPWWLDWTAGLFPVILIVFLLRSFLFEPFKIPSGSMIPTLLIGDLILVNKFEYGVRLPVINQKIVANKDPARGDVVVFKAPAHGDQDWIKRVIGLPGDLVQMVDGQLYLNGVPVPKQRIADFEIAISANTQCYSLQFIAKNAAGTDVCRYPHYRETLPGGRYYEVLDLGPRQMDNTDPVLVPEGHLFLMGDNRDNSEDSRFPAEPGRGIGLVPMDNLVGRATVVMWSTDGGVEWFKPWTWFTAARWDRLGGTF